MSTFLILQTVGDGWQPTQRPRRLTAVRSRFAHDADSPPPKVVLEPSTARHLHAARVATADGGRSGEAVDVEVDAKHVETLAVDRHLGGRDR
jgi:hypothetical protein